MTKVSIIIPVYNAEADIDNCLKSVTEQTYIDYEVIVVDDGSTDRTTERVASWEEKDKRIKLIRNTKKGVSSARNMGISEAKGQYIMFVDSDDLLSPTFVQMLVSLIENNKCECASIAVTVNFNELEQSGDLSKIKYLEGYEIFRMLTDMFEGSGGYACNKIYLASIINQNNILFNENISAGEDLLFNFCYLKLVKRAIFCDSKLYYYKLSSGSAVNRLDNTKWFDLITVYNSIMNSALSYEVLDLFRYNYALLILEALYRLKYCTTAQYTYDELHSMKKEYTKLDVKYTFVQNVKLLIFKMLPNVAMKYKRRAIKE